MMPDTHREILIRRATVDDAPAVAAVLREAFAEYRELYTDEGFHATTPPAEQVLVRRAEGPIWVAIDDAVLVGTVAAVAQTDAVYVRGMAVLPAARGLKVGEHLLTSVQEFAAANGYGKLRLSTTPFLARAIRLYERHGFEFTDSDPGDLFGTPLLTMEKRISNT